MSSDFQSILDEADEPETEPTVETSEPTTETEPAVEAVADAPAPVETETSAPVEEAAEAQPITREDGATWSEKAKRWYLDGKIVAGEAPAIAPEPSIPSVPQAPVVEPPPVPQPIGEPWTVRGGGGKHTIPGAFVTPEGKLVVEPEGQPRVKELIAAGIQHLTNYPRERQQYQEQIKAAEARAEARAAKYNSTATMLYDILTDDEKLARFINNLEDQRALLTERVSLHLQKHDLTIPQQAAPQEQDVTPEVFGQTLHAALDELIEDAPKGLLTAEDIADMKAAYAKRMNAYAAEHEGEIVLDFHAVRDDFARDLKMYQRAQSAAAKAAEDARRAKEAARFNAANVAKPPVAAPTKPTAKPALAAAPSAQKPGWDQRFNSVWKDDDED